jgi:DNA-directed RNA polymerase specialized sigma24 family protein
MDGTGRVAFDEWYRSLHPRLVTAIAEATGDSDVAADAADEACSGAQAGEEPNPR